MQQIKSSFLLEVQLSLSETKSSLRTKGTRAPLHSHLLPNDSVASAFPSVFTTISEQAFE